MGSRLSWTVITLLVCALAATCVITLTEGAEAGLEKPAGHGPYEVGFNITSYIFTGNDTEVEVTLYYPATSSGLDAPPDTTEAPYPTILWYHTWELNDTYLEEVIDTVVSHGFVFAINYYESHPYIRSFSDPWGMEFHSKEWTEMVDQIEALDVDPSSVLYGMVDREAYGISGHSSGTYGWELAFRDGRYKAIAYLCGAWLEDINFYADVKVPSHWQPAENLTPSKWRFYGFYEGYDFLRAKGEKSEIKVKGSHFRDGGYDLGAFVAFFLVYLDGKDEYRTFLYGDEVFKDVVSGAIKLRYDHGDGNFFPPNSQYIVAPVEPVIMDSPVNLELVLTGYPLYQYSEFVVDWYVDGDLGVITDKGMKVSHTFTESGTYKFAVRWNFGGLKVLYNWTLPVWVTVKNMPPVAVAVPEGEYDHDATVVFDGSGSWDTASHNDRLEFKWSFSDGNGTEFSDEPTYERTLTSVGTFVATLSVRDPEGAISTVQCILTVHNLVPSVKPWVGKTNASEDEVIDFSVQGIDTPSDIGLLKYRWDFGDSPITDWRNVSYNDHAYTKMGTYEAVLWVMDPHGAMTNATVLITVENEAPEGGIDEPKEGKEAYEGSKLVFAGWGKDTRSDNESLRFVWDFGDGATAEGARTVHKYSEEKVYTVTLTIEDDDGATKVITRDLKINPAKVPPIEDPRLIMATCSFVTVLMLAAVATTEIGKYWFGLLSAPLFTKMKDVLDNKTRHALLGIIVTNPGIHYTAIREEFDLANGQAAYHLSVLERENFIKSVRDGNLKRFYAATAKVPKSMYLSNEEMREELHRIITARPGISQRELIEEVGYGRDSVGYHLREMVRDGSLLDARKGKYTIYYPRGPS